MSASIAAAPPPPVRTPAAGRSPADLRWCLLAAAVLHDLDLEPDTCGVRVLSPGGTVHVPWDDVDASLGDAPAAGPTGSRRLAGMLRSRAAERLSR